MGANSVCTCLWFDTEAEEAAEYYVALLPGSRIIHVQRQFDPASQSPKAFLVEFELMGQSYIAMNGGPHYKLSPAASIQINVDTQSEVDRLWEALLAGGGKESRCGWLTDRFGLSWQIIPRTLPRLIAAGGPASGRVIQAMMTMVKLDIEALEAAAQGK